MGNAHDAAYQEIPPETAQGATGRTPRKWFSSCRRPERVGVYASTADKLIRRCSKPLRSNFVRIARALDRGREGQAIFYKV